MRQSIVLVEFYWGRDKDPRVPLGHASLLASLARADVEVASVALPVNHGFTDEQLAEYVLADVRDDATDVAFGVYVWNDHIVRAIISRLRERGFRGRIILGGPQITYSSGGLEQLYPGADLFIRGYGEDALLALVQQPATREPAIRGVHRAGDADLAQQTSVDLEQLPSPWLAGTIALQNQHFIRWETQRGCPFRCAFCQHRSPDKRFHRRLMDKQRVAQEVDLFCASTVNDIAVLDPIFNVNPDAQAIVERFAEQQFRGRLSLQCRAERLTEQFLDAVASLNVRIELGLQTVIRTEQDAVRRRNSMPLVDRALAMLRERNINHEVSIIFGLPGQTVDSFVESVDWCLSRGVPTLKAFPLMLLRGTELEQNREQFGLIESDDIMPVVVESPSFSRHDWERMDAISAALRATEGQHPACAKGLPIADRDHARWTPISA